MSKGTIRLEQANESIRVNPATFLADSFDTYLAVVRRLGASYDRVKRCNYLATDKVHDAIRELSVAGFEVEVDERISHALEDIRAEAKAKTADAKMVHDAAVERMDRIDSELMKRGLALYPFQRDGVRWMSHRHSALLCDEMGLGKTVQALISAPENAPIIVVAPAAVKGVWYRETRRWRPDLGFPRILQGRDSFRWPKAGEVVITNYDILPSDVKVNEFTKKKTVGLPSWIKKPAPGTILIYDEVHAVKNPASIRTKICRILSQLVREADGYVWGLTGTPMLNRAPELWHVLLSLGCAEEAYGDRRAFKNLFDWNGNPRSGEAAEKLQLVSLMRRREEVLPELPTKTWSEISVPIDESIRALLDRWVAKLKDAGVDLSEMASIAELVAGTRRAELDIGEISRVRAALAKAKLAATLDVVQRYEDEGQCLIVCSAHRFVIDTLAKRPGWATITGSTPAEDRTKIEEAFQDGRYKGLSMTIKAGGVGITLTHAHHMLFVDKDWTPGWNSQCEDRVCRIGQDRGVQIISLVADHIMDEKVNELLTDKTIKIDKTVNASAVDTVGEQFLDDHVEIIPVGVVRSREQSAKAHAKPDGCKLERIRDAIDGALANGGKQPKISLPGLQFKQAGHGSKYQGHIHVSNGAAFGSDGNQWYGTIDPDGNFKPAAKCTQEIVTRMKVLNKEGAILAAAKAHGLATHSCCFCGIDLTHPSSEAAGYGPICAGKYGLPWGE